LGFVSSVENGGLAVIESVAVVADHAGDSEAEGTKE
jgi:hypothetical protein